MIVSRIVEEALILYADEVEILYQCLIPALEVLICLG